MRRFMQLTTGFVFLYLLGATNAQSQKQVPYAIDFSTEDCSEWTALDNSTSTGTTWTFKERGAYHSGTYYPCVVLPTDWSVDCDDYWISPALYLEAGVNYTVETLMTCGYQYNGSQVELSIGTAADDASTFSKVGDLPVEEGYFNIETPNVVTVSVEQSGNYHLAYHATSPAINSETCLFDFKITSDGGGGTDPEEPVTVDVPYSIDLRTSDAGWTVKDNNNDGNTWTYTSGFGTTMNTAIASAHNDDYVSPGINLVEGQTYKITTDVAVMAYPNSNDQMQLLQGVGDGQLTFLASLDLPELGDNVQSVIFEAKETGVHHFAFRNLSSVGGNNLGLYSFSIEETEAEVEIGEVVLESDFSGDAPLFGWMTEDANGDGTTWGFVDGMDGVTYNGNTAAGAADDWLITPAIEMVEGVDYIVEYTFSQAGAFDADVVEVAYGAGQMSFDMTNVLATETYDFGSGTETRTQRMTATATGNVYLGFHIVTSDMNGTMSLTQVKVVTAAKATPMPIEGLVVTSSHTEQTVTLEWTNPTLDTNQTPIVGTVDINIMENGSLVGTLKGVNPGEKESYTHTPSIPFTGDVTYGVVALIGNNQSDVAQQTISLDDLQGDSIFVTQFSLATQDDFGKWKIEDKNGGKTWQYVSWAQELEIPMGSTSNNDWAITPGVEMSAGVRYVLSYELKTHFSFGADLDVTVGNAQTALAQTTELESHSGLMQNAYAKFVTKQFSVESDGTYYFGFHAGTVGNGMRFKNVQLMYIGEKEELVVIDVTPYVQDFDENSDLPEGWRLQGGDELYGFKIVDIANELGLPDFSAHSTPNALYAEAGSMTPRDESIFTPMFAMEVGKEYEVSFWLNMPSVNGRSHNLQVYALEEPDESLAGEPIFEINQGDVAEWTEQSFTYHSTEEKDICFMIKVTCDLNFSGWVAIDDFTFDEYVPEVAPAAPQNLRGGTAYPSSIILNWTYPTEDVEGNPLSANSNVTIKIYDQHEYLGEQSGKPGSFGSWVYDYGYNDPSYAGQIIIKAQSYIGDLAGYSSNAIINVTSLGEGYLKEYAFDSANSESDDWVVADNDNDGETWTADAEAIMFETSGQDEWLFSPSISLEVGRTYYVTCSVETGNGQNADLTFALADSQEESGVHTTLATYENLELTAPMTLELGYAFTAEDAETYLAVHAVCNEGSVKVKDFRVMRIFGQGEPEAVPYEQDFEDRVNVEELSGMPNKWGRHTTSASLFNVTTMPDNTIAAHSGQYAAVAEEFSINGRTETLYTPMFDLDEGGIYEITYWLYMPGNEGRNTYGNVLLSPTQSNEDVELPVIQVMGEPLDEWTEMKFEYTHELDNTPVCFWFYFAAEEANAGIIAIDDFSIRKTGQVGLGEVSDGVNVAYFVNETSTLVVGDGYDKVSVYNVQGMKVASMNVDGNEADLSELGSGVYVVVLEGADATPKNIKIVK